MKSVMWFDLIVIVILIIGIFSGRKAGMSNELLPVLQWLLFIVVAGMFYAPLGALFYDFTSSLGLGQLFWNVASYLLIVVVIRTIFTLIKRAVGEKLVGSDLFGRAEFYLGMFAGMIRFSCMIVLFMALINAKPPSPPEKIAERERKQRENFGSISFPGPEAIHGDIMIRSLSGGFVRTHLSHLLIVPSAGGRPPKREGPAKQVERQVDEVLGSATNK